MRIIGVIAYMWFKCSIHRSIMFFDILIQWSNLLYLMHWLSRDSCFYVFRIPIVCCHIRRLQRTRNDLFSAVSTSSRHCNNTHGERSVSRHALKHRGMTTDAEVDRNRERERIFWQRKAASERLPICVPTYTNSTSAAVLKSKRRLFREQLARVE